MFQELRHALVSPAAILRGNTAAVAWLCLYLVFATLLFGWVAWLLDRHQASLEDLLMTYFFPTHWHGLVRRLTDFLFASQTRTVIVSMMLSGGLVATSVVLFPLKEKCSLAFELAHNPQSRPRELPLWLQALEEAKLLWLYLTAYGIILAIGYYPFPWCKALSSALSVMFLFFSFALDFVAPLLQRHGVRYGAVVRLLWRYAPAALVFGALFSAPLLWLGRVILDYGEWTLLETAGALFLANVFFMAWAIPAGTAWAASLMRHLAQLPKLSARRRWLALAVLAGGFATASGFHGLVALSLHHKSQVLKCEYDLDWSSVRSDLAGIRSAFFGGRETEVRFDLYIKNPTRFDVVVEKSQLLLKQQNRLIGDARLSPLAVPSHSTVKQSVRLQAYIDLGNLSGIGEIREGWAMYLVFELLPGLPFMLALI